MSVLFCNSTLTWLSYFAPIGYYKKDLTKKTPFPKGFFTKFIQLPCKEMNLLHSKYVTYYVCNVKLLTEKWWKFHIYENMKIQYGTSMIEKEEIKYHIFSLLSIQFRQIMMFLTFIYLSILNGSDWQYDLLPPICGLLTTIPSCCSMLLKVIMILDEGGLKSQAQYQTDTRDGSREYFKIMRKSDKLTMNRDQGSFSYKCVWRNVGKIARKKINWQL